MLDATFIAPLYGGYLRDNDGISNGCLDVILPQALQKGYFFHGIVAISRTIKLMSEGLVAREDSVVIFHRGQALAGIQEALSDVNDDVLPLAVMHMVSLDVRRILLLHGPMAACDLVNMLTISLGFSGDSILLWLDVNTRRASSRF
jgi:hypothetical protein